MGIGQFLPQTGDVPLGLHLAHHGAEFVTVPATVTGGGAVILQLVELRFDLCRAAAHGGVIQPDFDYCLSHPFPPVRRRG